MSAGGAFTKAKDFYMLMNIAEKRGSYKCKDKFVELSQVKTWTQSEFDEPLDHSKKFQVRTDLNDKISLWQGDITALEIDAIVNAANKKCLGGGGVDGAIHSAAGKDLYNECLTLNGCETGEAKITGGYKLPAKYVIHTVGPVGEKPDKLQSCYQNSLSLLLENNLKSIAFPCISTGVYHYPRLNAASEALGVTRKFLEEKGNLVDRIIFCVFLNEDLAIYEKLIPQYFPK